MRDYIARIRRQLVRVLDSQAVALPEPEMEAAHAIRVTLAFVRIAFQECTPDRMRGYGEVPESKIRELSGLVDEMVSAVDKLDSYVASSVEEDLESRLVRLAKSGTDVENVRQLHSIIDRYGFVEFRQSLAIILDRMETKALEVASSGASVQGNLRC